MSTTLPYAPAAPAPVRFHYLVRAATLLTLTSLVLLAETRFEDLLIFNIRNSNATLAVTTFPFLLHDLAILIAVFLFDKALPPAVRTNFPRWQFLALALAALALLLTQSAALGTLIWLRYHYFSNFPTVLHFSLNSLTHLLQSALAAAAALYFYSAARRLNRRPLGIAAAAAFLPPLVLQFLCSLLVVYEILHDILRYPLLPITRYSAHFPSLYSLEILTFISLTLLFLILALVSSRLALKFPRQLLP